MSRRSFSGVQGLGPHRACIEFGFGAQVSRTKQNQVRKGNRQSNGSQSYAGL